MLDVGRFEEVVVVVEDIGDVFHGEFVLLEVIV